MWRSHSPYEEGVEEKAREYAVIVDGRIIRAICEACKRRFWEWA